MLASTSARSVMGSGGASTVTDCGAEGSQATGACAATCWAAPGLTRILTEAYWGWE